MLVLGIESSCDETAAAVVEDGVRARSNVVASQATVHAAYGGVVPEIASRCHLEAIGAVVEQALTLAKTSLDDIGGIAVTRGPGLIGSLLVGVSFAKAVATARGLPLVGVNHIEAHIQALALEHEAIAYPAIALVVSGGHTALYLQRIPSEIKRLGATRDDAVGEAFDKVAKLLGLGYPGGPAIDRLVAGRGDGAPRFPRARLGDGSLDFSFSGLKSAVARHVRDCHLTPFATGAAPGAETIEIAAAFQAAAVDTLLGNLRRAVVDWRPRSLLLAGGVACNSRLREAALALGRELAIAVHLPSPALATDNAAMVAALGYQLLARGVRHGLELDADPGLRPGDDSLCGVAEARPSALP